MNDAQKYGGHRFVRPLTDPMGVARCVRCGCPGTDWTDLGVPCPGEFPPPVSDQLQEAVDRPLDTAILMGDKPAPTAADFPELAELTDSERVGVAVVAMVDLIAQQRDTARGLAMELEQQLAEAVKHLRTLVAMPSLMHGTTFAADTDAVDQANQFLEAVESPETPADTKDDA